MTRTGDATDSAAHAREPRTAHPTVPTYSIGINRISPEPRITVSFQLSRLDPIFTINLNEETAAALAEDIQRLVPMLRKAG
jgi:hypothetical protein